MAKSLKYYQVVTKNGFKDRLVCNVCAFSKTDARIEVKKKTGKPVPQMAVITEISFEEFNRTPITN